MAPECAYFECWYRVLDIVYGACRGSEVEDYVYIARDVEVFGDILLDEAEVLVTSEVLDVLGSACDEVIQAIYPVSFRDQSVAEM